MSGKLFGSSLRDRVQRSSGHVQRVPVLPVEPDRGAISGTRREDSRDRDAGRRAQFVPFSYCRDGEPEHRHREEARLVRGRPRATPYGRGRDAVARIAVAASAMSSAIRAEARRAVKLPELLGGIVAIGLAYSIWAAVWGGM